MQLTMHVCQGTSLQQLARPGSSSLVCRAFTVSSTAPRRALQSQRRVRPDVSRKANDRTAAPPADTMSQTKSPDGSAVIEHSEQFLVHLKAAINDPQLQKGYIVTDELKELTKQLEAVPPKDRKKLTKDGINGKFRSLVSDNARISEDGITTLGTLSFQQFKPTNWKVRVEPITLDIGQASDNQYQTDIPITITEGPLEGMQAIQSTIGEYSLDENEPNKQNVSFTKVVLRPGSSDSASLDKWKEVMKKENESMNDDGEIVWTAPQPMKGFRDFLYHDHELQISLGNRGTLTIIQK